MAANSTPFAYRHERCNPMWALRTCKQADGIKKLLAPHFYFDGIKKLPAPLFHLVYRSFTGDGRDEGEESKSNDGLRLG